MDVIAEIIQYPTFLNVDIICTARRVMLPHSIEQKIAKRDLSPRRERGLVACSYCEEEENEKRRGKGVQINLRQRSLCCTFAGQW